MAEEKANDPIHQTANEATVTSQDSLFQILLQGDTSVEGVDKASLDLFKTVMLEYTLRVKKESQALGGLMDKPDVWLNKEVLKKALQEAKDEAAEELTRETNHVLHDKKFQKLESTWRGIQRTVAATEGESNVVFDLYPVSKATLREDAIENEANHRNSKFFQWIYGGEYGTPGGTPYTAVVTDFGFGRDEPEVKLLGQLAKTAMDAHAILITAPEASFFGMKSFRDLNPNQNWRDLFRGKDYVYWRAFRDANENPHARYVGMVMPEFLGRSLHGPSLESDEVDYRGENVNSDEDYLWCPSSFGLAANIARSCATYNWPAAITGYDGGGRLELPLTNIGLRGDPNARLGVSFQYTEEAAKTFSDWGFIPVIQWKNNAFAIITHAQSAVAVPTVEPGDDESVKADKNSERMSATLPYLLIASRIAHFLKVMLRERLGDSSDAETVEKELKQWLQPYVLAGAGTNRAERARRPFTSGTDISVKDADNVGYYDVDAMLVPHYLVQGFDVAIQLVAKKPG